MPHIKVKFCSTNYYSLKLLLQPFKFTNKIIHCAIVTHQYSTFKDIQKHYCNHAHITGFCPITTCFKQKFLHNFHKWICPRQAFPSIFKTDSEKWSAMSNLHLKKEKTEFSVHAMTFCIESRQYCAFINQQKAKIIWTWSFEQWIKDVTTADRNQNSLKAFNCYQSN